MAKKRKSTARGKSKKGDEPKIGLSADAKREITAIILITLAILILLASVGFAGSFGRSTLNFLKILIGLAAYLLSLALVLVAWVLFQPDRFKFKGNNLIGLSAFFVFLAALLTVAMQRSSQFDLAASKNQGGLVGFGLAQAVLPFLNRPVAMIVLIALLLISLVIATNTRIKTVFGKFKQVFLRAEPEDGVKIHDPAAAIASRLPIRGTLRADKNAQAKDESALTSSGDTSWQLPDLDLLESNSTRADAGNVKENVKIIADTLGQFGIDVTMEDVNIGPTVTQYTLKPSSGVKLNKITTLDRDLALALAAHPIRIEAPIPGKSQVGVEVPNKKIAMVRLHDLLASKEMQAAKSKLEFVMGRDVSGEAALADLSQMPHLLIAGATGSGKSVMINTLITSLLYRNSPADLKLILVDPKRVEMTFYNDVPHLLSPVIVEPDKTISALKWAVAEMERRYRLFADTGNKGIIDYNQRAKDDRMPYIVVVIDELADLMMVAAKDVEALIVRLAQMGRAAGVHLVIATQRPSVNVITGTIKANIPARIALSTTSQVDSRTIIDQSGAEKLLGKGDMLFLNPEVSKPKRIQVAFVSNKEIESVAKFLRSQGQPQYNEEVLTQTVKHGAGGAMGGGDFGGGGDDELFEQAVEVVLQRGRASASDLQRRLRVGYSRAARLMDMLEEQGVIGPPDGARPREVLIGSMSDLGGSSGEVGESGQ